MDMAGRGRHVFVTDELGIMPGDTGYVLELSLGARGMMCSNLNVDINNFS
tara:strand:+ start:962 stop:1111 length:150 start_codon:yes stop_codon:yes gene_type:complete